MVTIRDMKNKKTLKSTNNETIEKHPKSMRTAFIRVSYHNGTSADGIVDYTFEGIVEIIKEWNKSKGFKYYMIDHTKEADIGADENGEENHPHCHIVLKFESPTLWENIKEKFPYGRIESARNTKWCIQYLVHYNHPDKVQFEWSQIVTNDKNLEKYKIRDKISTKGKLEELLLLIDSGKVKEYNLIEHCTQDIYIHNKKQILDALEFKRWQIMSDKNRNISVLFFEGDTGTGKTTFAKDYCKKLGLSFCISSSSNDPMQDYKGEDVLILDDLRPDAFKFHDLLKILDNHTGSTVRSRYSNKAFTGSMIIITSSLPLDDWYRGVEEDKEQFHRRISCRLVFDKNIITNYEYKYSDLYNKDVFKKAGWMLNPVKNKSDNEVNKGSVLFKDFGYRDARETDDKKKDDITSDMVSLQI